MEFFELVLILSITVLLPITIVRSVVGFKKSKLEAERGLGAEAGITVGELKKMLADAVREANAPLVERVEALERIGTTGRDRLPSGKPPAPRDVLVDAGAGGEAGEADEWAEHGREAEKSVGRRVRG
jgi:hypothetical protein